MQPLQEELQRQSLEAALAAAAKEQEQAKQRSDSKEGTEGKSKKRTEFEDGADHSFFSLQFI